jgi:outer membrane protein TolC
MRIVQTAGILLLLLLSFQLKAQYITIDSCYERAKRNYPLIRQYGLIEKSTDYTVSNANKSYLPQVSLTGIAGYLIKGLPSMVPSAEADKDKFQFIGIGQLNQTVWDGGATHAVKEIANAAGEVQKAEVDVAMRDITERVNQLFFSILLMDDQLKLLSILTDNLNRNVKAVKLTNENGLAYSPDVDEVKVELLKVEQRTIEIKYAREGYVNMLALLIGEPIQPNTIFEKPVLVSDVTTFSMNRAELNLFQYQRRQIEAQHSLTKVGYMPKVGLLAAGIMVQPGFPFGFEKINSLAIAGLSVSWNTSSIYKSGNERELTKINLDRISNQQETFLFNTNLQLTQQRSDVEKQKSIVAKDDEIVSLKASIKRAYELKYQNGMCTMNDLLMVTNAENEARNNKALHVTQLLMSYYTYKTTTGN